MSDRFDIAFDALRGQRPPVQFAAPEAVRRRGARRTLRQAVAVAATVLTVSGAAVGWAAGQVNTGPDRTPPIGGTTSPPASRPASPTPSGSASSTTPSPTATDLAGLMLRPVDLGSGSWPRVSSEPFESADRWYWADLCPAYRSADYPSLRAQLTVDVTGYRAGDRYVYEHIHRYRASWGRRALDDVRSVLARCAGPTAPPASSSGPAPSHYAILDTGFAGDEALLVREDRWGYDASGKIGSTPFTRLIVVVRVGDLVATVLLSPERDAAAARAIGVKAADRLRAG
jgi:hypothetical protein